MGLPIVRKGQRRDECALRALQKRTWLVSNAIKDLASFFDAAYQQHAGTRYPFNNGKDAKILKDLRAIYSDDDLHRYMVAFFEVDDDFIQNSGYGLGVFRGCLPKVIQYVQRQQPKADSRGHLPPCKTVSDCIAKVVADGKRAREA